MTWTLVNALIVSLCAYRLVMFVGKDDITRPLRLWMLGSDPTTRMGRLRVKIHSFLTCPWCLGFWMAIGIVLLVHSEWNTVRWGCYVLAISAVVGILSDV
jgi:hypothetical protein